MYKFMLLCPVTFNLLNFNLYHEVNYKTGIHFKICQWAFAAIYNLDLFFWGIMTLLAMESLLCF